MKHTKAQKLRWVKAALVNWHKNQLTSYDNFTCWSFYDVGGQSAGNWYSATTINMMTSADRTGYEIAPSDFAVSEVYERDEAREMWMNMLATLVEANEV